MLSKTLIPAILLLFNIFFISCDFKKQSVGEFDIIYVFADSSIYNQVSPDIEQTFDQFIYTPRAEKSFYLQWEPLEKLNVYKMHKNLLFVGLFNGEDAVSLYLMKMLSSDVQQAMLEGKIFHIFQEDLFARDQMSIILFAPNITQLIEYIQVYRDDIFTGIEQYHFRRLEKNMFLIEEQKGLEEYLYENFNWTIKVQYEYKLILQSENGDFVWLKKLRPDRNIFVFKYPAGRFNSTENFLYNLRDSLTTKYFEGDSIVRDDTDIFKTEFCNNPAWKISGVWKNRKYLLGGPFRTYTFFDHDSDYQYFIDISVVAPAVRKKPYLDELEVIANSFRLNHEKENK